MNKQRTKTSIETLLKEELHYCCLFAFFKLYRKTGMIAARLGVCERAVRYRKAAFKNGEYVCQKCPNCLRSKGLV